jgi:two-component system chemotaxis sensor kinase CheA
MTTALKKSFKSDGLNEALNELALQVVLNGTLAFTKERLSTIVEMAESVAAIDLADEANSILRSIQVSSLDQKQINQCIDQLRSHLPDHYRDSQMKAIADTADTPSILSFENDPEMLAGFVWETGEHLLAIEESILLLEKDPSLMDCVHAVFRAFHTIKGLAGFLGLSGVQAIAHEVETLLDHARNLHIGITSEVVDLVLESSEYLGDEVLHVKARLEGTGLPSIRNNEDLLRQLRLLTAEVGQGPPQSGTIFEMVDPDTAVPQAPNLSVNLDFESPVVKPLGIPAAKVLLGSNPQFPSTPNSGAVPLQVSPMPRNDVAGPSIRVETSKLDRLMDMVGEMVIAQTMLTNNPRLMGREDARIGAEVSQLARITSEVQRCAMSMRLTPIGPLFQKSAKIVRDLSRRNGKHVSLHLSGEGTELDKTIAEELSDPLLHMVRNALDHGIETTEERIAAGKNPMASLRIGAIHQGGQVTIFISDDGRGLNAQRILQKAIEKGLVDKHVQLDEDQIFNLIFAPGFSTAEKITDISGRGVGMDVVRKHVETLRGRIEINSQFGSGTTFLIHLPLTLAIIEGLVVVVGSHRYIIPIFSIREMFRPTSDMLFTAQGRNEMILVRGELFPMVRLHKRFSIPPRTENICDGLLVVCEFGRKQFCLFVDDLIGRQEIVIKSLSETFGRSKGLAGCAILGDGRIGLILDVEGIFHSINKDKPNVAA